MRKPAKPALTAHQLAELDDAVERVDREEQIETVAWARSVKARHQRMRELVGELKAARLKRGLSLADVDARTGIGRSNLSRLENHHQPNPLLDTLLRYASAVGVDLRISVKGTPGKRRLRSRAA